MQIYQARNFGFEELLNLTKAMNGVYRVDYVPEEVVGDQVREARVSPQDGSDTLNILARGDVRM